MSPVCFNTFLFDWFVEKIKLDFKMSRKFIEIRRRHCKTNRVFRLQNAVTLFLFFPLGLMPYNFMCCQTGVLLSEIKSVNDIMTRATMLKLTLIAIIVALPGMLMKKYKKKVQWCQKFLIVTDFFRNIFRIFIAKSFMNGFLSISVFVCVCCGWNWNWRKKVLSSKINCRCSFEN